MRHPLIQVGWMLTFLVTVVAATFLCVFLLPMPGKEMQEDFVRTKNELKFAKKDNAELRAHIEELEVELEGIEDKRLRCVVDEALELKAY